MLKSLVSPFKSGFLNSLKQHKRRRLQSQTIGFGDSLEIRLLLTGPQLVNPTSNNGYIVTDVASDHGGTLTVNVDVGGDGTYEFSLEALEGEPLLIDLTAYIPPNTSQNVILQIVEEPLVEGTYTGPEMSSSVTMNVGGITVLATEFEWIDGSTSVLSGSVDMTNNLGAIQVLYRVAGDTEWGVVGEISDDDGSFVFSFAPADGETDFEFVTEHSFMGAAVLGGVVTITDMTAYIPEDPGGAEPAFEESLLDDLFAEILV